MGSRRAFDRLLRKYQSPLRRMLLSLSGGDEYMVDDIAQDTFVRAWTYIDSYSARSSFKTWLYAIAYRVFYDYAAMDKRYAHDDYDVAASQIPAGGDGEGDMSMDLYRALSTLRYEERTAIVLCYMEGYTYKQISQVMALPEGTVKSLIYRGKKHLSVILKK